MTVLLTILMAATVTEMPELSELPDGVEVQVVTTVVVVTEDGREDAGHTPEHIRATSPTSSDAALASAFAEAEETCAGAVKPMGFDTAVRSGGFEAELFFRCRDGASVVRLAAD